MMEDRKPLPIVVMPQPLSLWERWETYQLSPRLVMVACAILLVLTSVAGLAIWR